MTLGKTRGLVINLKEDLWIVRAHSWLFDEVRCMRDRTTGA